MKKASVYRNVDNEIIIDKEGYITCHTDSMYTFLIVLFECVFCAIIILFIYLFIYLLIYFILYS